MHISTLTKLRLYNPNSKKKNNVSLMYIPTLTKLRLHNPNSKKKHNVSDTQIVIEMKIYPSTPFSLPPKLRGVTHKDWISNN